MNNSIGNKNMDPNSRVPSYSQSSGFITARIPQFLTQRFSQISSKPKMPDQRTPPKNQNGHRNVFPPPTTHHSNNRSTTSRSSKLPKNPSTHVRRPLGIPDSTPRPNSVAQVLFVNSKPKSKKRRRKRRLRFEKIYAEDQSDVEGLVSRMRLLWSEYASSILEQHFIQSPQSLVVSLYSMLAMEHADLQSCPRTANQLYTMLCHADVPEELLVSPSSFQETDQPSATRLVLPNRAITYTLNNAQFLLTHHLASASSRLFSKLQNMQCIHLLRKLIARPRDLVPPFLITCPPEVDLDLARFLDTKRFGIDLNGQPETCDTLNCFTVASSLLPDWFTNPKATPLDKLAALLRLELASTTVQIIKSLHASGLTRISSQRIYEMVLRAVRLFAYTSHIHPNLLWTMTDFSSASFDCKSMETVTPVNNCDKHKPLWVLFSVSPGIVVENVATCTFETLVPERVFAVPRPIKFHQTFSSSNKIRPPNSSFQATPPMSPDQLEMRSRKEYNGPINVYQSPSSGLKPMPIPTLNVQSADSVKSPPLHYVQGRRLSALTNSYSIWASVHPLVSPTMESCPQPNSAPIHTKPSSYLASPESSHGRSSEFPGLGISNMSPSRTLDCSGTYHSARSSPIMKRDLVNSPAVSPQRTPSSRLLEAALVLGDIVRSQIPTAASRANSAVTTPVLESSKIACIDQISPVTNLLPPFPTGPAAVVGDQARLWLSELESNVIGLKLHDLPRSVGAENVLLGIRVADDTCALRKSRVRKSATFSIDSGGGGD